MIIKNTLSRLLAFGFVLLCLVTQSPLSVSALTPEQKKIYDSGIHYFDIEDTKLSSCQSNGALLMAGNDNAEKVWNYFISKGWQPHQVAGILGNMKAESGVNPKRVQGTSTPSGDSDTPPDGNVGYGLVQFTPGSKILAAAQRLGMSPGDLLFQVTLIDEQLNGQSEIPETRAGNNLRAATTVEEASRSFEQDYERHAPDAKQEGMRIGFAQEFMAAFGSGTGNTTLPGNGSVANCNAAALDPNGCPTEPVGISEVIDAEGIQVHPCIAEEVTRIVQLAKTQGLTLTGWGWRDNQAQIRLRGENGCPDIYDSPPASCQIPTAIPGRSNHERGTAIDFSCNGSTIGTHSNPCFVFLQNNTSLKNLESEPWHWSIDGR